MTIDSNLSESGSLQMDLQAIRQTALDYIEGWYEGAAQRLEKCIHPDLAKRAVERDVIRSRDRLESISALALLIAARSGEGKPGSEEEPQKDITILDVFQNISCVKVVLTETVDYLHVAKLNGEWVVVNILWTEKPA